MNWLKSLFTVNRRCDLRVRMVGFGQATRPSHVTHPFAISKGFREIELTIEEAEALRGWIDVELARPDVRRPVTVTQ